MAELCGSVTPWPTTSVTIRTVTGPRTVGAFVVPAAPGLVIAAVAPYATHQWSVTHQASGTAVWGAARCTMAQATAIVAALAPLADWTRPRDALDADDEFAARVEVALEAARTGLRTTTAYR